MAYWINEFGNSHNRANWRSFYCDDETSITNNELPTSISHGKIQEDNPTNNDKCSIGSEALVLSTGELYILNSNNEWVKL